MKETAYKDHGGGLSPEYNDPRMIAGMERLIAALGKRYNRHPRIAFIQLGLLGFWGEWHTWPRESLYASPETERRIIEAYRKSFPDKSLMVRYARGYAGSTGFDEEDRLIDRNQGTGTLDEQWDLSLVGDWDSQTVNSVQTSRTFNDVHEVLTIGASSLTHDNRGNLTTDDAGRLLSWDTDGFLGAVEVATDHTYRVGELGLLVHNNSEESPCDEIDPEDLCVQQTGNKPCWDIPSKYQYESPKEACGALGAKPKSKTPEKMDQHPRDCPSAGQSYHVTCTDHAPGVHDSAISCKCCNSEGRSIDIWKLARHD